MTAQPVPHLQPLGIGQLLDQTIRLYRRNFLTFVGIIALVQVPLSLLQLLTSLVTIRSTVDIIEPTQYLQPEYFGILGLSLIIGLASFVLLSGIASAAMTRAVADNYLGQPVSIVGSYRRVGRNWASLLGTLLLAGLAYVGIMLWFIVPCVGWLTGIGMMFFFAWVITPLVVPIVVLEGRGGSYAISRGWNMARRRFWWVVGYVVILFIFAQLVVGGPAGLVGAIFQVLMLDIENASQLNTLVTLNTIIQSLLTLVFSLLYLPLQLAAMTLLYFDLRVCNEGFDLALLAQGEAAAPDDVARLTAQAPAAERATLVTANEMAYFAGLSIGGAALLAVFFGLLATLGALVGAAMAVGQQ